MASDAAWEYDHVVKVLMLGDTQVGKSSIVKRFCEDAFTTDVQTTIGIDFKWKNIERNGNKLKLQVWDTAGQERFRTISHQYYRSAMGVVVIYSVTDLESFKNIDFWLQEISKHGDEGVQRVLVGNKIDMDGRKVSTEEGAALAKKYNFDFFEVSAKTAQGVEDAFLALVDNIVKQRWAGGPRDSMPLDPTPPKKKGCCGN